jgi:hypothetical protein
MDTAKAAAAQHVHVMETRIEKQRALIQQLEAEGADPAEQIRRLDLLVRTLEEMRIQLGCLSPTELDEKRSDMAIALRMLSEDGRAS